MSSSALPQESENKWEHSGTKSQGLVTARSHGLSESVFLETPLELIPLGASFQVLTQSFYFCDSVPYESDSTQVNIAFD